MAERTRLATHQPTRKRYMTQNPCYRVLFSPFLSPAAGRGHRRRGQADRCSSGPRAVLSQGLVVSARSCYTLGKLPGTIVGSSGTGRFEREGGELWHVHP